MTLANVLDAIQEVDGQLAEEARARHDRLTKPPGSLGRLEDLGVRLAAVYGVLRPEIRGKAVAVFAADHGVTEAGVSAYPKEVTRQMLLNFLQGGAVVSALARAVRAEVLVVDVGVDADLGAHPRLLRRKVRRGTRSMLWEPAMTEGDAEAAMAVGLEAVGNLVTGGANLLAGGEMGIGNTTAAAALTAVFTGRPVREVTGRGTGLSDDALERKVRVIEEALARHRLDPARPLEALAKVGGLEIAALAGFYLGAAAQRVPVVLDGFIAAAAALVAVAMKPELKAYLFASHLSAEPGHGIQLEHLELPALFDFGMRLGEGSGALVAMGVLEGAARVLAEMATFGEAGVSEG